MWYLWHIERFGLDTGGDLEDRRAWDGDDPEGLVADERVALGLRMFGADAVPQLVEELSQTNHTSEAQWRLENAAFALRIIATEIGPEAKGAVPALLKVLGNHNARVSALAFQTLGKIHTDQEAAVPALTRFVKYPAGYPGALQYDQHKWALTTLGDYGPAAKTAVPVILQTLNDPKASFCRKEALEALRKIDPEAAKAFSGKAGEQ